MFVNVRVVTQVQDNGLMVPLDAIPRKGRKGSMFLSSAPITK